MEDCIVDRVFLPIKVHAVKLAYRKRLLDNLIHGYFCVRRGNKAVAVTFDPDNMKCSSANPKVHYVSSKQGKEYAEAVTEYLNLKAEYDYLLNMWNLMYSFPPPKVNFPIKQFLANHKMDNDFYKNQVGNKGKYTTDNPTVSDLGVFKSKNEQMAADALKELGIPFKYETELYIPEVEEWINPDFLLDFYEIDRCAYLEVLGMNDKLNYAVTTSTKINNYSKGKYRPGREVIYVHLYDKYNFDKNYFIQQVLSAFDSMIPDSALEWGKDFFSIQLSSSDESCGNTTLRNKKASA